MQCKSYFLGLHTSRDLNVDINGSKWPSYNEDNALGDAYCFNGFMQPPVQDRELLYGKEVIKQTILKHESIFRDQVLELHRLYNRQRDIVAEIRRKQLHEYHIQLKTSQPSPIHSEISFENTQKTLNNPSLPWINPNCSRPSVTVANIIQPLSSLVEGKSTHTGQYFSHIEGILEDSKLLESKGKKFQKKMLDLQLPASEYMDSEEGESFEEEKVCDVPEVLKYPLLNISEVCYTTDAAKLLDHSGGVKHVSLGDALSPKSSLSKITDLFDLNEPLQLDEVASPNSVHYLDPISKHTEIPCQDLSRNTSTSFHALSQNTQTRSDLEACSNNLDKDKMENQLESQTCNDDEAGENRSNLNSSAQGFGSKQLPSSSKSSQVQPTGRELPMSLLLDQSNRKSWDERKKFGLEVFDRKHHVLKDNNPKRVRASNTPESHQLVPYIANSESSSVSSWRKSIIGVKRNRIVIQALPCYNSLTPSKNSKSSVGSSGLIGDKIKLHKRMRCSPSSTAIGDQMNLTSRMNERKSSSKSFIPRDMRSAGKIDLEAPISPENEECSPPRRESDENEVEIPFQFSVLEDRDPAKELARLAAEAIVSISSSGIQIYLESPTCESSEASSADSLYWFAGVVSSTTGGLENEFSGKDGGENLSYDAFDYFEVMTLKLTETKIEHYWFSSNGKKEEETDAILAPREQRKGRARRGRQWKDFQREVLPCLTSLSRHEVTEDLLTVEGMMEAAGTTPRKTGLARRRAGGKGWSRGRRRSCVSASYVEESKLCHALKQQTKNDEVGIVERSLTGWGKITRRRRGQRFPATNLPLILSQV